MVPTSGFVPSSPLPVAALPSARSLPPSTCSAFTGRITPHRAPPAPFSPRRAATIHMKKGRFQQPLQPRRQDQMALPEDGTPIFAIFVRTPRAKLWYPLGAVKGDQRSKSLVDALKGGFARSMYANALDKGIAQTVYGKDNNRFLQNAVRMYPQLKKYTRDLEFGYKVSAVGLEEQKTKLISKEMALPFTAWAKKKLDNVFKSKKE